MAESAKGESRDDEGVAGETPDPKGRSGKGLPRRWRGIAAGGDAGGGQRARAARDTDRTSSPFASPTRFVFFLAVGDDARVDASRVLDSMAAASADSAAAMTRRSALSRSIFPSLRASGPRAAIASARSSFSAHERASSSPSAAAASASCRAARSDAAEAASRAALARTASSVSATRFAPASRCPSSSAARARACVRSSARNAASARRRDVTSPETRRFAECCRHIFALVLRRRLRHHSRRLSSNPERKNGPRSKSSVGTRLLFPKQFRFRSKPSRRDRRFPPSPRVRSSRRRWLPADAPRAPSAPRRRRASDFFVRKERKKRGLRGSRRSARRRARQTLRSSH